jgi:hypothetical protein
MNLKKILLVGIAFVFLSFTDDVETMTRAFELADTNYICDHFEDIVGIKAPGESYFQKHDKKHASVWLNTFYVEQGISGFAKTNTTENEGFTYLYGKLLSGRRKYNVTIIMKLKEDKYKITSLRFN